MVLRFNKRAARNSLKSPPPDPICEPICLSEQEEDRQSSLRELKEDEWVAEEVERKYQQSVLTEQ